MGNCITSKAIIAEDDQRKAKTMEKATAGSPSSMLQAVNRDERKKEKRVRFRVCEEDANGRSENLSETKSGVVRIRLVLTQKELDRILNGENRHSSAEKLLKAIKMRSGGISCSRSNEGEKGGNWRPALECIPEEH